MAPITRKRGSSSDEVTVLSSGEEEGTTLSETTVSSLLEQVTVTRTPARATRTPSTSSTRTPSTSSTITKSSSLRRSSTSTPPAKRPRLATKAAVEKVKEVDLDKEVQEEFDRLESLKAMLAKTSVAVTYQGSPQARPRTVKVDAPLGAKMTPAMVMERMMGRGGTPDAGSPARVGTPARQTGTPARVKVTPGRQTVTPSRMTTPGRSTVTPARVTPGRPTLTPGGVKVTPREGVKPGTTPRSVGRASRPIVKSTPKPRPALAKAAAKPLVKPKPPPRVPKVIERGPIDCLDPIIVETDMGFPCNYCQPPGSFKKRREMIRHLQAEHPEELVLPEQRNPDLTGLFNCSTCAAVFHSKFTRRVHQRAHLKAASGACDRYYRYYLAFGTK